MPDKHLGGKQLVRQSLINFIGLFVPLVVGFFTVPIAIKGLGVDGFGVFSIIWVVLGYFAFLDFGISKASTKFVAEIVGQSQTEISETAWTSLLLSFVFGLIGAIILLLLTPVLVNRVLNIPEMYIIATQKSFYLSAIILPFILVSLNLRGILAAYRRFDLINYVLIPTTVISYLAPAMSYYLNMDLWPIIVIICSARVISTLFYYILCFVTIPELKMIPLINLTRIKMLLGFSGWVTVSSIVSPILVYIDRLFIGSLMVVSNVAFYTAPFDFVNRLRVLPISLMKTMFPEFSLLASMNNNDRIILLVARTFKYILLLVGIGAITLALFSSEFLSWWLGNEIAVQSNMVLKIFSIGIIFNSLAFIPYNLLQGIGKPKIPALLHMIELPIYIVLLGVLIHFFGITGAALAWFIRIILDFIMLHHRAFKLFPGLKNKLFSQDIELLTLILVIFYIISLFMKKYMFYSNTLLVLWIAIIGLMIFALWKFVLDKSERIFVKSYLKAVRFK